METLWPRKELLIFFPLESFVDKQLSIPTHYSICYTFLQQGNVKKLMK